MKRLSLTIVLFAAPLFAEFPHEEKIEIAKIGTARHRIAMAFKRAGEAVEARAVDAVRPAYHRALARTWEAHEECWLAWGHMLNSPGVSGYFPPRATRVQDGFNRVDNCIDLSASARDMWLELMEGSVAGELTTAIAALQSFDRSLPYLDWEPPSFPASFGPHSDWHIEQRHLHRTGQYLLGQTVGDAIAFFGDVSALPLQCNAHMRTVLSRAQEMTSRHTRGWGLMSGIVFTESWGGDMGDDASVLQAEVDASNQIRPAEFFQVALGAQYLWNKRIDASTRAGQRLKEGVSPNAFVIGAAFANLVECATLNASSLDEVKRWWTQGPKTGSAQSDVGKAKEFFVDWGDGWNDHDMAAAAELNFFHSIPVPPSGDACPEFAAAKVEVDAVTTRCVVVQVP